ncbi:hypothetical protein KIN20_001522 [Parelaphostrongylus tenuis]|uniref:CXXC-type domain-containing protein n=1 Tax=Parelaphostrongylus tenuis TaxID=148309 RepID=A0AAD5MFD1_PARTN|nr:hypothetical protein KIN20_001522 [Parelaphostrongylus tenuis]
MNEVGSACGAVVDASTNMMSRGGASGREPPLIIADDNRNLLVNDEAKQGMEKMLRCGECIGCFQTVNCGKCDGCAARSICYRRKCVQESILMQRQSQATAPTGKRGPGRPRKERATITGPKHWIFQRYSRRK